MHSRACAFSPQERSAMTRVVGREGQADLEIGQQTSARWFGRIEPDGIRSADNQAWRRSPDSGFGEFIASTTEQAYQVSRNSGYSPSGRGVYGPLPERVFRSQFLGGNQQRLSSGAKVAVMEPKCRHFRRRPSRRRAHASRGIVNTPLPLPMPRRHRAYLAAFLGRVPSGSFLFSITRDSSAS